MLFGFDRAQHCLFHSILDALRCIFNEQDANTSDAVLVRCTVSMCWNYSLQYTGTSLAACSSIANPRWISFQAQRLEPYIGAGLALCVISHELKSHQIELTRGESVRKLSQALQDHCMVWWVSSFHSGRYSCVDGSILRWWRSVGRQHGYGAYLDRAGFSFDLHRFDSET